MNVIVKLTSGGIKEYEGGDYQLEAEPNANGDLVIRRSHENMLVVQVIASHAAGTWVSHKWEASD